VFTLPADAGFVVYKFSAGGVTDNNRDKGFYSMVFSKNGGYAGSGYTGGGEAGYGLLRSPRYGLGIPGYFTSFTISDSATYMWVSNEIVRHPGSRKALIIPYLLSMQKAIFDADLSKTRRAEAFLRNAASSEEDLLKLLYIRQLFLHDNTGADSVRQVLLRQYPNGVLAASEAYKRLKAGQDSLTLAYIRNKTNGNRNVAAFTRQYKTFVDQFPVADAKNSLYKQYGINYDAVYRQLIADVVAYKDTPGIKKYVPQSVISQLPLAYYKIVQIPYDSWKTVSAKQMVPFAQMVMQRILYFDQHQPAEYWYYSPKEWMAWMDKTFSSYFITHASILMETGHTPEALQMAARAQRVQQYKSATLNEIQAQLLEKNGDKKALSELLQNSIRKNQATAIVISMLKKEYRQQHPGTTDNEFDTWLESLKDAQTMALMKEDIARTKQHLPSENFTLEEMDKGMVQLAEMKGKTVVLDFWATWCAPCKAGMAGMKMVADRYKNDSNVVFFFIDTQEKDPVYRQKVKTFLQEKGYTNFRVLFDKGEETYALYAHMIHTSGIPFKVIIDPRGALSFASVGYKGSPTGLSDEISTMIELSRK
jgi:thiol-disulfide isomerase/thioredoxin